VLYTDGVTESLDTSNEQFGEKGLKLFMEQHPDITASEFADGLLERVSQWTGRAPGQEPDDDVTLLAVHFNSPGK
jgi:phosphoserine phosphatase RsbU/P